MNDIQKKLESWKVEREVDEYNESYAFREGYVKAMCDAINLVKNLTIPDVSNLLPCPFCGEKAETVKSGDTYTTMCMNQDCSVMVQSEGEDKETSESIWNVRAR